MNTDLLSYVYSLTDYLCLFNDSVVLDVLRMVGYVCDWIDKWQNRGKKQQQQKNYHRRQHERESTYTKRESYCIPYIVDVKEKWRK